MPAPVYTAGSVGNVINAVSVPHGATIAAFLDLGSGGNAAIEGQLVCEVVTGGTAPTAGTTFAAYKAYAAGAAPPITFSAGASAAATSISVNSNTGLHVGQNIALAQVGGSKLGEVVTISAISGAGPYALTVPALLNSYSTSDAVYLITQTATGTPVMPSSPAGTWAINKVYSAAMYLGTGQYVVAANNADASAAVTVSLTDDRVTSYT